MCRGGNTKSALTLNYFLRAVVDGAPTARRPEPLLRLWALHSGKYRHETRLFTAI